MLIDQELILIPQGDFIIGADPEDGPVEEASTPSKKVWLSSFCIQKRPVSVGEWYNFTRDTEYFWDHWSELQKVCPGDDYPIVYVSWQDCTAYAEWVSRLEGRAYSLPTEAQWEKACRGTDGRQFPWGNDDDNYSNLLDDCLKFFKTRFPIGRHNALPSAYGCLEMSQNVYEHCRDWYDDSYYLSMPNNNPLGPPFGSERVIRGMYPCAGYPHPWWRYGIDPATRSDDVGFRLVVNCAEAISPQF